LGFVCHYKALAGGAICTTCTHPCCEFLGQPWLRPRDPEEAQDAAQQRRCPVKYKPPVLRSTRIPPRALTKKKARASHVKTHPRG
jgi:hypothetical protein